MATEDDKTEVETSTSAASQLFDLRTVIAVLFGVYGLLLLVVAFTDTGQAELAKAGGIHINLYTAIVMLITSALFVLWVRLKPPLTGTTEPMEESQEGRPTGH